MYQISIKRHFDAAHFVRDYPGNCAKIHGHRWIVILNIESEQVNELGLTVDFRSMKGAVDAVIDEFDHTLLNDHEQFQYENPTTENICRYLYEHLTDQVEELGSSLASVEVWESPTAGVKYAA